MIIQHVFLATHDLRKLKEFYTSVLGFRIQDNKRRSVTFQIGRSALTFIENESAAFYHFACCVSSDAFYNAFKCMNAKVAILDVEGSDKIANFPKWNAQSFYFHDPAGNIVEFIARNDSNKSSKSVFNASLILSINEIGIVCKDIKTLGSKLRNEGLNYYFRGPELDDFIPVGDDEGLILLCSVGKGWMPTGRPAEQYWSKVIVSQNGKEYELITEEK